jgi:hypothetical protein
LAIPVYGPPSQPQKAQPKNTMTIDIRPIKIGDDYYVGLAMDGHAMGQHGPFLDVDEAEAMARRLMQAARALTNSRLNRGNSHG